MNSNPRYRLSTLLDEQSDHPVIVRFLGLQGVNYNWNRHNPQGLCQPEQSTQLSSLVPNAQDYFLPGAVALLIRVAALLASTSFSKPNTVEYFRPTTCAITKLMLIPASPTAMAIAWPSPGRLSPSVCPLTTRRSGVLCC
jgi:hypothetical protein